MIKMMMRCCCQVRFILPCCVILRMLYGAAWLSFGGGGGGGGVFRCTYRVMFRKDRQASTSVDREVDNGSRLSAIFFWNRRLILLNDS